MTLDQIKKLELHDITIFQIFETSPVSAENFYFLNESFGSDKRCELLKLLVQTVYLGGLMTGLKAMEEERHV